jgi:hypothetical protein
LLGLSASAREREVYTRRQTEKTFPAEPVLGYSAIFDHDWDGRIQKMNVEKTFKDVRYSIEVKGRRYVALIMTSGIGELHLPGESQPENPTGQQPQSQG